MIGIAARGWRFSAFGVQALHGGGAREAAVSGMAGNFEKQPGDGLGVGRIDCDEEFAGDAAAVVRLPGGPGEMFAEWLSFDIGELGFGSFQRPVKLPAFAFAGVNLVTVSVQLQNKFFVDRRLQRRRDFLLFWLRGILREERQ